MRSHHKRRKRRIAKQKLRWGAKAKRGHKKIGGRTGSIEDKRPRSKKRNWMRTSYLATTPLSVVLLSLTRGPPAPA